jgi:hypothetical protein
MPLPQVEQATLLFVLSAMPVPKEPEGHFIGAEEPGGQ